VSARVDPRIVLVVASAASVLAVDQATKVLVEQTMHLGESIAVLPVLSLTYVRNPGAAFGLLGGVPDGIRLPLLIVVTALALWVLVQLARDTAPERWDMHAAIGGVLGGALGNLVCRLRYGEVIDFVHLHWGEWYWPMFNVADSAITVGVIVIALRSLGAERKPRSP
jgi:signal peptidase II